MDLATALPFIMFAVLLALILTGFPVAYTLAGTALLFAGIGHGLDLFAVRRLGFIADRIYGVINNFTLVAVPLFIFMGIMLEKSLLARDLLTAMETLLRRQRGGLAIAVVVVGAVLAASTGIVGATVVTMGVLTLPTMIERGYNKDLSCGAIAASGTLGQIIPPSIVLILLGDIMNVDVGRLFTGAIVPGFLLVLFYLVYIGARIRITPGLAPQWTGDAAMPGRRERWAMYARSVLPPAALIALVLGSILTGVATPTEAASCGAVGALIIVCLKRRFSMATLRIVLRETVTSTTMVFTILMGAQLFGIVFIGLNGDTVIESFILQTAAHENVVLVTMMLMMFVLGFFLDFIEICFIVIPIVAPLLIKLGFDPLWLAIMIAINLQTSFLTPPFGFALFYLKGVAPKAVETLNIYRGIVPFVVIQLLTLVVLFVFPETVLWLPRMLFGAESEGVAY